MTRSLVLDTGVLGSIAHPRPNRDIVAWLNGGLRAGAVVVLPEIADYELRRNFLPEGLTVSIQRLDQLKIVLTYLPLNTAAMLKAAELWAMARKRGKPTADPRELDGDVILAAQALELGSNAVVVTENVGHLSLFIEARTWRQMP